MSGPRYSKEEFARRGDALYETKIRPLVEEGNQGKFVLIDQSTNGTYVRLQGNDEICLLNGEELPLVGEGLISLGRPVAEDDMHLVSFSVPH